MADQVELENSVLGKLKLTGQTALLFLVLAAAGAGVFGVYLHFEHEAKAGGRESTLVKVLERSAEAQERMVKAQREQNCLMRIRPEVRDRDRLCEELSK